MRVVESVKAQGANVEATPEISPGAAPAGFVMQRGLVAANDSSAVASLPRPQTIAFAKLPALQKQQAMIAEVARTAYKELPALGSAGLGGGRTVLQKISTLFQVFNFSLLNKTFDTRADFRPARDKLFHPFGSVGAVEFVPTHGHGFTGVFKSGAQGIARLSLASDEKNFGPGLGLKLFVGVGEPSRDVHAVPSFDAQESKDFFALAPSNVIPEPKSAFLKFLNFIFQVVANTQRRPVDHLAVVDKDGRGEAKPVAPYQVVFQPADVHFPEAGGEDFRKQLATIPPGTTLYVVQGRATPDAPLVTIGSLVSRSEFIASSFGDRELSFKHQK